MRFDFTGRYMAAFGFVAANVAGRLGNELAGIVRGDSELGSNNAVYLWDKNTSFDEVTLYEDVKEKGYVFGFRSITDDYSSLFATPPMLSLKRSKKLIITPVNNSDTTVVERYTTEPYEITWRGLLIDMENHEFPLDKMEQMNKIFEVNGVWNVASEILQAVGVQSVFIKDLSFDFVEGYEDTISYTMTMQAIRPLEYDLIKN
ncbi:MAG: DUF6046 domain-containing protein [Dysgonamonadaceae bacterium]|jgi:hypothetical protein|nr:DUF6046 domain-containing protein [Dysgonamonadaceae bacterium]